MAQRQARQSPLYFDLTTSWSKDISIFHASLGAAVQRARDTDDKRSEALAAGLLAEVDRFCVTRMTQRLRIFSVKPGTCAPAVMSRGWTAGSPGSSARRT